jgi:hypothetical protein
LLKNIEYLKIAMNLVGVMGIITGGLDFWQYISFSYLPASSHEVVGLKPALIAWEIFLGLWLISGALPIAVRRIAVYEQLAQQEMFSGKTSHVAFVRVPSDFDGFGAATDPGTGGPQLFHASPALHGTMDNSRPVARHHADGCGTAARRCHSRSFR